MIGRILGTMEIFGLIGLYSYLIGEHSSRGFFILVIFLIIFPIVLGIILTMFYKGPNRSISIKINDKKMLFKAGRLG